MSTVDDIESSIRSWPDQEFTYKDKESGVSYNSPFEWFWCDCLGFCGCYSKNIFNLVFVILKGLYNAKNGNGSWYYDYKNKSEDYCGLQELILHVFDSKKITEHGTGVRGCWLTEEGHGLAKIVFETKPPMPNTGGVLSE